MRARDAAFLAVWIGISLVLQAHEFWMEPDRFRYQPGEVMKLNCMVGEQFAGERWNLQKNRVIRLDHHGPATVQSVAELLNTGHTGNHLELLLKDEGTHLFVLQSSNAFVELQAADFNAYLKEDGLEDILKYRQQNGTINAPAREYYQRNAKLLVQAGGKTADVYRKITGLPLEIIALQNPYTVKLTGEIKFRVLFEGKPLPYAMVKVWNRKDGRTFMQNLYTEKDGTVTTRLSNTGLWMVSCVKMVPAREAGADWQSYWGSLVFGL
ncbi:MAG: hypothetical protein KatS3mg032_1629 [Cyclobacteriaceae bacterium]|nr:MAG: hypothetical protein KatS3mg032_1629 [Cyclobacteriaceae bacterium]